MCTLSANVGYVPSSSLEYDLDVMLAELATGVGMQRHAGVLREEYSVVGAIKVQCGKNLLEVENLIGTGGIFKYGRQPERILRAARFAPDTPWSLMPRRPRLCRQRILSLRYWLASGAFPNPGLENRQKIPAPDTTRLIYGPNP